MYFRIVPRLQGFFVFLLMKCVYSPASRLSRSRSRGDKLKNCNVKRPISNLSVLGQQEYVMASSISILSHALFKFE